MKMLFRSKRFWLAVSGVIFSSFGDSLPIDQEQLTQIVMIVAAWIVGDSLRATDEKQGQKYYGR